MAPMHFRHCCLFCSNRKVFGARWFGAHDGDLEPQDQDTSASASSFLEYIFLLALTPQREAVRSRAERLRNERLRNGCGTAAERLRNGCGMAAERRRNAGGSAARRPLPDPPLAAARCPPAMARGRPRSAAAEQQRCQPPLPTPPATAHPPHTAGNFRRQPSPRPALTTEQKSGGSPGRYQARQSSSAAPRSPPSSKSGPRHRRAHHRHHPPPSLPRGARARRSIGRPGPSARQRARRGR